MTHDVECVTNHGHEFRPCVVKGAHRQHCDGYARRYDAESGQSVGVYTIEFDAAAGENRRWLVDCPGCLPRPAVSGQLCAAHVRKLEAVFDVDAAGNFVTADLVTHLWSIYQAGAVPGERVSGGEAGSRWTLSESRIAAAEILDALGTRWSVEYDVRWIGSAVVGALLDPEQRAHSTGTEAARAVRLVDAVMRALRRFPLVESERPIPNVHCPRCGRLALVWRPPLTHLDEVDVRCERCSHTESQEWLEAMLAIAAAGRTPR